PPVVGTATAGGASVSVACTAPADNGGSTITSYTASCTSSDGGAPGSASGGSSPIVVTALTNGNTYECAVIATNAVGDSGVSGASNDVMPISVPGAPTMGTASAGAGSVSVSFTAPADDGGRPITRYTVTCLSPGVGASAIES